MHRRAIKFCLEKTIYWLKYSLFCLLFLINVSYGQENQKIYLDVGGALNFNVGHIAGKRASAGIGNSGFAWLSGYMPLEGKSYLKTIMGVSLERSSSSKILLNDLKFAYYIPKHYVTIGRSLNAAGELFHDLTDFGAPGAGTDNTPVTYFSGGAFPTNVAQKITQPFAQRLAYYVQPFDNKVRIGVSYAPFITDKHPLDYQFFANSPTKNEFSIAAQYSGFIGNWDHQIGASFGYTQARRKFNKFNPSDKISATQMSFWIQKENRKHVIQFPYLEFNIGRLQDSMRDDYRVAIQYNRPSYFNGIYSYGIQQRFYETSLPLSNSSIYTDGFVGYSFTFEPNIRFGIEGILRQHEDQFIFQGEAIKRKRTDFHLIAGLQYQF